MSNENIDKELAQSLKDAKTKLHNFVLIVKGENVQKLLVSKKFIKDGEVQAAKKESHGTDVIRGQIVAGQDSAELVFQIKEETKVKAVKLRTYITDHTQMAVKPRFEVVAELVNDVTDPMADWKEKLAAWLPEIKSAIEAKGPRVGEIVKLLNEANELSQPEGNIGEAVEKLTACRILATSGLSSTYWQELVLSWTPLIKHAIAQKGPTSDEMIKLLSQANALSKPGGDLERAIELLTECRRLAEDCPRPRVDAKAEFESALDGTDQVDPGTIEEFFGRLSDALTAVPEIQEHFEKVFKSKGCKIKFDPNSTDAYFSDKTIVLPTKMRNGENRDADDLIDALIFESCNADVKEDYEELDKRFTAKRDLTLGEYGVLKAGIEATKVTLRAARMSFAMQKRGLSIAQQGQANLSAIQEIDGRFFESGPSAPSEAAKREKLLLQKMLGSKHNKHLDPSLRPEDLKNPQCLKSGEVYHYEKTKSLGIVTMVGLLLKPLSAVLSDRSTVQDWIRTCATEGVNNRDSLPMVFCLVLDALKKKFPNIDLKGLEFSSDMRKVAEANGTGVTLPPLPKELQ